MKIIGQNGYIGSTLKGLDEFNGTILLAGHSSVQMCINDPEGAWVNNVEFFKSVLITCEKPLIYASSATVYDGLENPDEDTNQFNLTNMYNFTKHTIDGLAKLSGERVYGLRFATVNGWSPNLRVDVMLNKMVYDAKTQGKVVVKNPHINRPILGIRDLRRAIWHILDEQPRPGVYNLASFSASVEDMAEYVADRFDVQLIKEEYDNVPAYAYGVDTTRIERVGFKFEDSLESIVNSLDKPFEKTGVRT